MTPRHFLDLSDLTPADLRGLLDRAHARKAARAGKPKGAADADQPLNGHMLGMVFDKPSTRTRLSFDLAMRQLGGQTMLLNHADTQLGRGESIEDTARVMSRFCDIVMLRTGPHENLLAYADGSDVPVINGLTAFSHPCQILADLMTFEEHKGALAGQRIAWFGDGNNVAISLAQAAALLGFEFALAVPDAFMLPDEVLAWAADKPGKITRCDTPQAAADGAAALVTDCWVSMSDDPETAQKRATAFAPYQVTQELMARGDDAIFLHCLPAYRGNEVTADVIDGPKSVVFDEAENRCHAQKAVLIYCLGIDG
ncbi:MAG: ornithine carbamoyltransferase [Rhizobiales bacterium TMED143]|nr:ornithine carbamoyltransferase [Rhodobiaceae bacterium]MBL6786922.1 ornithine carbamoyltransferase [PS1 clade bacterium]OUV92929.1 MAG: ornithine carbamoyltransferase [Rhizobiales bacterium TMED143]HCQ81968.1 ornithine carbamoyltransferase [Rhodobiaceae bacterium]|tara:strand:- start:616 stop:1551 length:936 start_codon:yes stop_codon:yes gene_type:complete